MNGLRVLALWGYPLVCASLTACEEPTGCGGGAVVAYTLPRRGSLVAFHVDICESGDERGAAFDPRVSLSVNGEWCQGGGPCNAQVALRYTDPFDNGALKEEGGYVSLSYADPLCDPGMDVEIERTVAGPEPITNVMQIDAITAVCSIEISRKEPG